MIGEEVVTVLNAAAGAMLFLVKTCLNHRVASVSLAVLRRILFLDLLIHAH